MITVNPCNVLNVLWNNYSNDFNPTTVISERESNLIKLLKSIIDSSLTTTSLPTVTRVQSLSQFKRKYTSSLSSSSSNLDLNYESEGQQSPVFYFDDRFNYHRTPRVDKRTGRVSPAHRGHSQQAHRHTINELPTVRRQNDKREERCQSIEIRQRNTRSKVNRCISECVGVTSGLPSIPPPVLPSNVPKFDPHAYRSLSMVSLSVNDATRTTGDCRPVKFAPKGIAPKNCHDVTQEGEGKSAAAKKKKNRQRLLLHFLLRRPSIESLEAKGIIKNELVFGCDLKLLCHKEQTVVPKFVESIIYYIEMKNLKTDGIYRVCGNLSQVQKLRFQINQDNYNGVRKEDDIHILTSLCKMFLRDMKEPLISYHLFHPLIAAVNGDDYQGKINTVRRLINSLHNFNYHTLKCILQHLLRVEKFKDDNRMHISNLAIVFGPTLMWPDSLKPPSQVYGETTPENKMASGSLMESMMQQMKSNKVVEFLLNEFNIIFCI